SRVVESVVVAARQPLPPDESGAASEIDAVEVQEALVAGRDHAISVAEALEHLDAFGVAPAEAHRAPLGIVPRVGEHEHPLTAGVVVERAVREHEDVGRLADLEPHSQRLTTADQLRRGAEELEVDLELAVAHVRINLADLERVLLAADVDR